MGITQGLIISQTNSQLAERLEQYQSAQQVISARYPADQASRDAIAGPFSASSRNHTGLRPT